MASDSSDTTKILVATYARRNPEVEEMYVLEGEKGGKLKSLGQTFDQWEVGAMI